MIIMLTAKELPNYENKQFTMHVNLLNFQFCSTCINDSSLICVWFMCNVQSHFYSLSNLYLSSFYCPVFPIHLRWPYDLPSLSSPFQSKQIPLQFSHLTLGLLLSPLRLEHPYFRQFYILISLECCHRICPGRCLYLP